MRTLAVLPLLLVAACWNPRYFAPRERVAAVGPDGMPAALYLVPAAAADQPPTAEVRVWSRGASARFTDDDREVVELHVGFEVENNGPGPVQLDLGSVTCEEMRIDGVLQPPLSPLRIDGDGTAPPGFTARVDLVFETPAAVPRGIDSFVVRFVVRDGAREALRQVTPFAPWVRVYDDPYWYGYGWSWGFGFGVGWHSHAGHCHH